MNRKLFVVPAIVCLSTSLWATNLSNTNKLLETNVTRLVAENSEKTPYAKYKEQLAAISEPSYQTLRPLFQKLAIYNDSFAHCKNQDDCSKLADMLATEVHTGWNNYRSIGMLEIFDSYFPQENADKDIALLEYNIKANLLSEEQRHLIAIFESMNTWYIHEFNVPYNQLRTTLQMAPNYQPKEILEAFVTPIKAYNALEEEFPEAAYLVKRSAFIKPVSTGWGRTMTLKELSRKLGIEELAGGDDLHIYTPEELQKMYGVSADTAKLFFQFVNNYNRNK